METVTYRAPELTHWFGADSREHRSQARASSQRLMNPTGQDLAGHLRDAANAALQFGKGTAASVASRQAESTVFVLHPEEFEKVGATGRVRIRYQDVTQIVLGANDRHEIVHAKGRTSVKPVAHLVRGRVKVPIGWRRNGIEVPFHTLVDEIATRCNREVEPK